ncbi:MAG: glycosyltransferase family 4 protein [Gemmatimonadota bacterium]|nr:MAG: glycosyltransferase family 4 protein [Gemmatimonadota bacterium]
MSKIALIVPGGVDPSGSQRVIPALLWLIKRLAVHHDLHVFALRQPEGPPRYELLGATVHDLGAGRSRVRSLARSLRILYGEHERAPFALLHALWAVPPGFIAAVAGKLFRVPVLLHLAGGELVALHDVRYGGRRTLRGRLQVWTALRGAARITAASAPMQAAAACLGYPAQRMPLGVDIEEWPARAPRPRDPESPARLLYIASLNRVKDPSTLLRAAARLAEEGVRFNLDVVGTDTLAGETQRAAETLGLSERVRFHGVLTHDRLRPLVERADLLLVSSRHEAGPVVALEAAVAGVPTVGTAVGHVAEWAPEAAVAVPIGDDRALAAEIAGLLADDSRRLRIAAAAQARALECDADWTAGQVLRNYAELLAS